MLHVSTEEEDNYISELKGISDSISYVKERLRWKIAAENNIGKNLGILVSRSQRHVDNMSQFYSSLDKSLKIYEKTENRLLSNIADDSSGQLDENINLETDDNISIIGVIKDLFLTGENVEKISELIKEIRENDAILSVLYAAGMPTREEHYNRNQYNEVPNISEVYCGFDKAGNPIASDGWKLLEKDESIYHTMQFGEQGKNAQYNRKFVKKNEDGTSSEVIICFYPEEMGRSPEIVTDPFNEGTYNFADPSDPIGHFVKDMIPYYLWGNQEIDGADEYMKYRIGGPDMDAC